MRFVAALDWRLRLVPIVALLVLIGGRMWSDDFLAIPVGNTFLTWYWVILIPLLYVAAICISPTFVSLLKRAGRWFVPPILLFAFVLGAFLILEAVYNHTLGALTGHPIHVESRLLAAVLGGNA